MKFNYCSSALSSQVFTKKRAIAILRARGVDLPPMRHEIWKHMEIQVWARAVWLRLPAMLGWNGFCIIVSQLEFFHEFELGLHAKSYNAQIVLSRSNFWGVKGSQGSYVVIRTHDGKLDCQCLLFKMLKKRLKTELPWLWEKLDLLHPYCHHIELICCEKLGLDGFRDFSDRILFPL